MSGQLKIHFNPSLIILCICLISLAFQNSQSNSEFRGLCLFLLWPLVFNIRLSQKFISKTSQIILFISSVLYLLFFIFIYQSAFSTSPDAFTGLAIITIGVLFLPVMIAFWIVASILNTKEKNKCKKEINKRKKIAEAKADWGEQF